MGCTTSQVPDPNTMYGQQPVVKPTTTSNGSDVTNGTRPVSQSNGVIANGKVDGDHNGNVGDNASNISSVMSTNSKDVSNRTLKGDLTQRSQARISRERTLLEMHKKREEKAQRISELVMEEKERLSLSTLSRSRATSRTGSPRLHRGDSMRPCTSSQIDTSISSPVPKSGSEESLRGRPIEEVVRPSALKSANGRRRKGEPKVRIVTDDKERSKVTTNAKDVAQSQDAPSSTNTAADIRRDAKTSNKENITNV